MNEGERSRRRSFLRNVAFGVAVVLAGLGGIIAGSKASSDGGWGCPLERRGHSVIDGTGDGGSATKLAAAEDWVPMLAEDGTVSEGALRAAFANVTGPSSYDPETGELRIDGQLQATFTIARLQDGTWVASSYTACMRPAAA